MARTRKTWQEKLEEARAKTAEAKQFFCEKSGQQLLIPPVAEVEELVRGVKRGQVVTVKHLTEVLRDRYRVDMCCPLTTGIFLWIVAHAAEEAGGPGMTPWWRVVKADGSLNPKYPGQGETQRAKLEAEGHRVVSKGKKLVVEGVAAAR